MRQVVDSQPGPSTPSERPVSLIPRRCARLATLLYAVCLLALALAPVAAQAKTKAKSKAKAREADVQEITIESPVQGTIARPGSSLTVRVGLDPAMQASQVSVLIGTWNELISYIDDAPPYVFAVPIDQRWSGPVRLMFSAQSARGNVIGSGELLVNVVPSDLPVAIAVTDPVRMVARRSASAPKEQINVRGTYADGTVRDVGRAELGTSFYSSDPRVVAVDGQGFLTAGVPGRAIVTVKNGELSAQVPVSVQGTRDQPLPAVDVTRQDGKPVGPV